MSTAPDNLSPDHEALATNDLNRISGRDGEEKRHLAFYMDHLRRGGVAKMRLLIAGALADRGHKVDLVICESGGPLTDLLPENIRTIYLEPTNRIAARTYPLIADPGGLGAVAGFALGPRRNFATLCYLPALGRYLRQERPDVLHAATTFMAIEAAFALRQNPGSTKFVVSEHIHFAPGHAAVRGWNRLFIRPLLYRTYDRADAVLGISNGVADEMARRSGFPRERIRTITNPTVTPQIEQQAAEPLDHPWFQSGQPPVVLGVGRLSKSKDFKTLVRAFAQVRLSRPLRLVILGDANAGDPARSEKKNRKRKAELMDLAAELGVAADVDLPGFAINPYQYMARAAVYVLSSRYEGLPNALIEAMACGCPVVSTDTPSGPAEILEDGKYGPLLPIGDVDAMASAISKVLDTPPEPHRLRERAANFSLERAAVDYEAVVLSLT